MEYQNNNDYMRDAFFYSTPQNSMYNGYTSMNSMQGIGYTNGNQMGTNGNNINNVYANQMPGSMVNTMPNNMQMQVQMNTQRTPVSDMYPQIYRIINPVANRVISSSNYPFYTEDNLSNLVDTVYNIVEGDIDTLSSNFEENIGDDTVMQDNNSRRIASNSGNNIGNSNSNNNSSSNISGNLNGNSNLNNSSNTSNLPNSRNNNTPNTSQNYTRSSNRLNNHLLRDLIKIIIIKNILSRQSNFIPNNTLNSQFGTQFASQFNNGNNYFDPRIM